MESRTKLPAVILAAGKGERLTRGAGSPPKPLTPILGLTLLERTILSCREVGICEFFVVLGYRGEEIEPRLSEWEQKYHISITPVKNRGWQEGNGTSVLACAPYLKTSFLLLMCDHLFDPGAIPHLIAEGEDDRACYLLVDRRTAQVFDEEDATRVRVEEGRITAIEKGLKSANGIDTGIFLCRPFLFDALQRACDAGDGSLSGGMRFLTRTGKLRAVDLNDRFWIDVDTPGALKHAHNLLIRRLVKPDEDGFVSRWCNRLLSTRLSAFFVTDPLFSRLTPNAISLASFFIVLLSAFLFALKGGYAVSLAGGILSQLGSIVDGCDGEVARLTFRESRFGAWLDTLLDRYGDAAVATGITYGFSRLHTGPLVWVGGILALSGFLLASYTKKEYALRYGKRVPKSVWTRLMKRDLRLFALFLGALFGHPYFALLAVGLLSHVGIALLLLQRRRFEADPNGCPLRSD
jgi:CDP-L-myo-inositol myo-inositolphosphotransferase